MTPVGGQDQSRAKTILEDDHGSVGCSEREISVFFDQPGYPVPILRLRTPHVVVTKTCDEPNFRPRPESLAYQVSHLGHHKSGNDKAYGAVFENGQATAMIGIVLISGRVKRPRINDCDARCQFASW